MKPLAEQPRTVEDAVDVIMIELPLKALEHIHACPEDELDGYHRNLGGVIRYEFRLRENQELLDDCGAATAHDTSAYLIWALWTKLRKFGL